MTQAKIGIDDMEEAKAMGMNPYQAAKEFGAHRANIVRAEARTGVTLRRSPPGEMKRGTDYREVVQGMKPIDAVEYLLTVIDDLRDVPKQPWVMHGVHLTAGEKKALYVLARAGGACVSRDALMRGYMADRGADDEPEMKIIDVYICKLRKKLSAVGVAINTSWGVGYSLTAPDGYIWPWEADA